METRVRHHEISEFLESYAAAFNRVDSAAIADMYHMPCLTVRGDGSIRVFHELAQVREFMGSVAKIYYDEGNRASSFNELAIVPIGNQCVLASLKWTLKDEDEAPIREWRQSYNLIQTKEKWKFLVSTFHRS